MIFQVIWFILWAVLWAVYFMLDGFDLGAGILYFFFASDEKIKKDVLNTIGPVWDGNEVWLITAGGATFAAFPTTYALMFSYLYSAMLLLLFSLILRGVALEFRGHAEGQRWRKGWDRAFFLGSFLATLLLGVAFGNIFKGLPMDVSGYHGSLPGLLNPYGLLTGVLFVLLFAVHGSLWLSIKLPGSPHKKEVANKKASALAGRLWYPLVLVAVGFLAYTAFATRLYINYLNHPILWLLPAIAVAALLAIKYLTLTGRQLRAFFASCVTILFVVFTGVAGLYPDLIPSSLDPAYSLTLFNSSSSVYTLRIMTVVAVVFVPVVIAYQLWIYRIFGRTKTALREEKKNGQSGLA
ncbi:MAG: cytochrome d ubiquinol oxidase subunit II [Nitrospiraceae bacterium]|nr:cytochrome d ubiquinol oxidase subunit II [Nitrospiraceae bacterium]MDA8089700.1 cytochrome d ubiquinol oxidase subunit II [Nitrospiraceae bacterium]